MDPVPQSSHRLRGLTSSRPSPCRASSHASARRASAPPPPPDPAAPSAPAREAWEAGEAGVAGRRRHAAPSREGQRARQGSFAALTPRPSNAVGGMYAAASAALSMSRTGSGCKGTAAAPLLTSPPVLLTPSPTPLPLLPPLRPSRASSLLGGDHGCDACRITKVGAVVWARMLDTAAAVAQGGTGDDREMATTGAAASALLRVDSCCSGSWVTILREAG